VVAVASPPVPTALVARPRRRRGWLVGAGVALVVGIVVRLGLGGGGTGDVSAAIMLTLLAVSAWITAMLLSTPRTAFFVTLSLVALADLAGLPARNQPEYDGREAFYRTDQVLSALVPVEPGLAQPTLTLLVEPVFPTGQNSPTFGLAGEIGGTPLAWSCLFQRGIQRLALQVPPAAAGGVSGLDVRLRLTGTPSRESDYLVVYASARRGGFVVDLRGAEQETDATMCALT
jgi:hypothetical protein